MFKKNIRVYVILSLIATVLATPVISFAGTGNNIRTCVNKVTYDRIADIDELLKLAINQSKENNNLSSNVQSYNANDLLNNDQSESQNNGIIANQLIEERTYSDGSIEKDYIASSLALENKLTGDTITYYDSSLYKSMSLYNVVACQMVYYTLKLYESGVPGLYNDVLIRASQEQSWVSFPSPSIAFIKHGIRAQLMGAAFPYMDAYAYQTPPGNNTVYIVYATNTAFYKDNMSGGYFCYLDVQTTSGNFFELQIDLLSLIDG